MTVQPVSEDPLTVPGLTVFTLVPPSTLSTVPVKLVEYCNDHVPNGNAKVSLAAVMRGNRSVMLAEQPGSPEFAAGVVVVATSHEPTLSPETLKTPIMIGLVVTVVCPGDVPIGVTGVPTCPDAFGTVHCAGFGLKQLVEPGFPLYVPAYMV